MSGMNDLGRVLRGCSAIVALAASLSMVAADFAEARGERGGGGGSAQRFAGGGGAAKPAQRQAPRAPSAQRQGGDFGGGLNRGGGAAADRQARRPEDRAARADGRQATQGDRQGQRTERADGRQDVQGGRQDQRTDRSETRGDTRGDRQDGRTDRTGERQDGMTDRSGTRQTERTSRTGDRQETRRQISDDIAGNRYWSNYHYHYHNDYWDDGNAAWALFAGLTLGAIVASLPPRYETVTVAGAPYYYANGTYYVPASGGYQVAPPPVGATVRNPPTQVVNVYAGNAEYGYADGAFYEAVPPKDDASEPTFTVVAPPIGASAPSLPDGAEARRVKDVDYFVYAGTWYQPFYSGSTVIYQVVAKPEG